MSAKVVKNMDELRKDICQDRADFKDEKFDHVSMKERSNNAGKIINTVRIQVEKAKLNKEKVDINFLKCH